MPEKRQLSLNFSRAEQLSILRNAVLSPSVQTSRGGVSGVLLKAVLKAIDDHGRECFASQKTLAREVGCSKDHIKRVLEALKSRSLICEWRATTPGGITCWHRRIVWSELALLDRSHRPDQGVMVTDQGVMVTDQGVMDDTQKRIEATQEAPTPSTPSATWQTAEAEVVKHLDRWQEALNTAKGRVPPQYVVALVRFFESAGSCFRPGALYVRLRDSHPGMPIDKGWPPPADPSRECREAMTILGQCRKVAETMPPMTEEQFRKRYLAQLEKLNLAGFFRESLTRESLTRESLAHVPIPG